MSPPATREVIVRMFWKLEDSFQWDPPILCYMAKRLGLSPADIAKIVSGSPVPKWYLRKSPMVRQWYRAWKKRTVEYSLERCEQYYARLAEEYALQCKVAVPPPTEPPTPGIAVRVSSPEWQAWLREIGAIANAVLTERQRELFSLHYEQGLTYKEIADIWGLRSETVKEIHRKALDRVHRQLAAGTRFRKTFGYQES